jgi:hypothetical protein
MRGAIHPLPHVFLAWCLVKYRTALPLPDQVTCINHDVPHWLIFKIVPVLRAFIR